MEVANFRVAIAVLDLDKLGMSGNLAVDVGIDLRMKTRGFESLVTLHVLK